MCINHTHMQPKLKMQRAPFHCHPIMPNRPKQTNNTTRYCIIQKRWSYRRNESGNKGEMLRSMNVLLGMVVNQKRWREARAHFFDFAISQRSFRSTTACLTYCPTRFFYGSIVSSIIQYRIHSPNALFNTWSNMWSNTFSNTSYLAAYT